MAEAVRPTAAQFPGRASFEPPEDEPDDELAPGTTVVDRYRVTSLLGRGGMGTVYLAEHLTVGRRVALKVLNGEWSGHSFVARRFQAEARIASAIGHPNIVEVFDAGALPDGRLFLVMEHLGGHDLAQEIADHRTLSPRRAAQILRQIALALAAAHDLNIIHRDLKPGNIMISRGAAGELVKILDFGIACSPRATARQGQRLTLPGSVMGTPEYMAPEQSTSAEPNPRFDLYALGVIAYEMLTGDPPITADHAFEVLVRKRQEPSPSLAIRAPRLHPDFIALIDDCLQIDPDRRPTDVHEFLRRLDAVLPDLPDLPLPSVAPRNVNPSAPTDAALTVTAHGPPPLASAAFPTVLSPAPSKRSSPTWLPTALALGALALGVLVLGAWAWTSIHKLNPHDPTTTRDLARDPLAAPATPLALVPPPPLVPPSPLELPLALVPPPPLELPLALEPPPLLEPPPAPLPRAQPANRRAFTTPACERVRLRADEARRTQAWGRLRDLSKQRTCWPSDAEARKLQAKALMELGDFNGCIHASQGLKDMEVQQWRKLCERRAG